MLEKLEDKRNRLKENIEEEKNRGIDVSAKEKALLLIDHDFFGYYRELRA